MKLGTIKSDSSGVPVLVTGDGEPVPVERLLAMAGLRDTAPPASTLQIIEHWSHWQPLLERAGEQLDAAAAENSDAAAVVWCAPVTRPSKIVGCAINNAALNDLADAYPENPPFFAKLPSALTGHGQPIVIRPDYGLTHPEGELAVIIGSRCKNVAVDQVPDVIFGYTVLNDVTSIQMKSEDTYCFPNPGMSPPPPGFEYGNMQLAYHIRSKAADSFAPCGPWLVTRDEIADPNQLGVRVFMGEEECASDNTSNLRFSVEEVVAWISRFATLEPGDIVHMGTAARGKYGLRELNFQHWDGPCAVEIDGIGRLSNPILRQDIDGNPVEKQAPPAQTGPQWPPRVAAK